MLSHRGYEATLANWSPTADYLSQKVDGYRFSIVPLNFEEIGPAVGAGRVDFVLANPGIYVTLEVRYGIARIATLNNLRGGIPYNVFGGVIFTRADRTDIRQLSDLVGHRFMAVDETSLGGFQMAWRELSEADIDPYSDFSSLTFAGTHDQVVMAVRDGRADAGTVRTDILERMERAGRIDGDEFRVIHPQVHFEFPFRHSTALYPEWPFAKVKGTSNELAQRVAVALLDMPSTHPAAVAGSYAGWTVPLDYQPVHELFKELRLGPYRDLGRFTLLDVARKYWYWLLTALTVLLMMGSVLAWVARLNKALARAKLGLERENEMILRAVGDGVYGVDLQGRCTFANPALERITGWKADELIGENQHDLLHHTRADGSPHPPVECPVFATFRDNVSHYVDNDVFWRKDGTSFPVEYVSTPVRNDEGDTVGAVVVFRDVTARRQAEEQLCQHQAELAHSARLSSMGEMASGIAHELNQPLAAIATYTSACIRMLKGGASSQQEVLEVMERVSAQAERAGGILRQIRSFIRKEEPEWKPVELNQVTHQVKTLLGTEARRKGVPFRLELADGLPPVIGYQIQLEQVVFNLARNAIEAMAETPAEQRELVIATACSGESVEVAVHDRGHGHGLSDEVFGRLFDPFFTTKSSGMGLGLSIARAIIESHNGQLSATPRPEGGAIFRFVLPRYRENRHE
ncbi:PhnD/SsuA/transferrin family substrate-binding protein [Endothiovibrio diazotrophicus]